MGKEVEYFFKWLKEVKGVKQIDLFEAIELYWDEFKQEIKHE